jgi:hypothetical protein
MLAFVIASMMAATSNAPTSEAASLKGVPTRFCREIGSAASRSQAVMICRTKAQWNRLETCNGATRYCPRKKKLASISELPGRSTAFPLNEDSRIVCRYLKATGSRLTTYKTCLPQREWERMWKDSAEAMLKFQDKSSRPPGEQ